MKIVNFGEQLNNPLVVCLGYFGCVHKGHLQIIKKAKQVASEFAAKIAIFTFSNDTLAALGKQDKALFTYKERLDIYNQLGVDYVIVANFDKSFMQTSGADFANQLKQYNLHSIVCGFDYTFGCDKQNATHLSKYFENVNICVVDAIFNDNIKISTSNIYNYVKHSMVEQANSLLYSDFFINGKVVCGRQVGTKLGFPTANLQVSSNKLLPIGVFGGSTTIDNVCYKCVINIGPKPTFDLDYVSVEVHVIGYDGNLYDKQLSVCLTKYLRDIRKFDSVDQLQQQLKIDKESV